MSEDPVCHMHSKPQRPIYKDNYCIEPQCQHPRPCCDKCRMLEGALHNDHKIMDYEEYQSSIAKKHCKIMTQFSNENNVLDDQLQTFEQISTEFKDECIQNIQNNFQEQKQVLKAQEAKLLETVDKLLKSLNDIYNQLDTFQEEAIKTVKRDMKHLFNIKQLKQRREEQKGKLPNEVEKFITSTTAELEQESLDFHNKVLSFYQREEFCVENLFSQQYLEDFQTMQKLIKENISVRNTFLQESVRTIQESIQQKINQLSIETISDEQAMQIKQVPLIQKFSQEDCLVKNFQFSFQEPKPPMVSTWTGFLRNGQPHGFGINKMKINEQTTRKYSGSVVHARRQGYGVMVSQTKEKPQIQEVQSSNQGGQKLEQQQQNQKKKSVLDLIKSFNSINKIVESEKKQKALNQNKKFKKGYTVQGLWIDDEPVEIVFNHNNGDTYIGTMKNWLMNGKGSFIFADSKKFVGEFKENELFNGKYYDQNNQLFQILKNGSTLDWTDQQLIK